MPRYIDADRLEECMRIVQKANKDSVDFNKRCRATDVFLDIWDMIKKQPTADVVEVVRCEDCNKRDICRTTNIWSVPPSDDWFCADGERREDDKRRSSIAT